MSIIHFYIKSSQVNPEYWSLLNVSLLHERNLTFLSLISDRIKCKRVSTQPVIFHSDLSDLKRGNDTDYDDVEVRFRSSLFLQTADNKWILTLDILWWCFISLQTLIQKMTGDTWTTISYCAVGRNQTPSWMLYTHKQLSDLMTLWKCADMISIVSLMNFSHCRCYKWALLCLLVLFGFAFLDQFLLSKRLYNHSGSVHTKVHVLS